LSHRRVSGCLPALVGLSAVACAGANGDADPRLQLVTVASGLEHPWGMAFLPDGRVLVTERPGRLRIIGRDGRVGDPIEGVPAVDATGQGGLLDVVLDPEFAANRTVYLSYAEPRDDGNGTSVARGVLDGATLTDVQVIFRQQPSVRGGHHFGSRLVFARDGRLFVTLGERNSERARAQTLDTDIGKIVRINRDGGVPPDNPFVGREGARPEIWSYGHRNVQGAALHPVTGELWADEHGPKGGDELNRVLPGRNYGWPVVSYGTEYSGAKISERGTAPGIESPVHYWVPSIAASGLLFYTGDRFPDWRLNAFVGGLKSQTLVRLRLDGDRVVEEESLLAGVVRERVRDVDQGPDGCIYLLTDEVNGRLLRLEPAPPRETTASGRREDPS
jgi:glucose/arabinose dehydrogenase